MRGAVKSGPRRVKGRGGEKGDEGVREVYYGMDNKDGRDEVDRRTGERPDL
jgi:hypothetical protein